MVPRPATGWDTFSVKSTSPAGVALTGQTSVPFEISSLSNGTEYAFTVAVQKTSGCDVGTTSDSTYNTHGCTLPSAPAFTDSSIEYSANKSSITINVGGSGTISPLISGSSLDSYIFNSTIPAVAIAVATPSGAVDKNASMVISGLLPGRKYEVEFLSQYTSSNCGGEIIGIATGSVTDLFTVVWCSGCKTTSELGSNNRFRRLQYKQVTSISDSKKL